MSESSSSKAGVGCLLLFLSPFLFSGLFMLGKGIVSLASDPEMTEEVIAMLGVGTMFTFVSVGLIALVFVASEKLKEEEALRAERPDEPWMWKAEWQDGRVASNGPHVAIALWIVGVVFSGFGVPMLFVLKDAVQETPAAYLGLLFPLVGLGMLASALYSTARWYKYGKIVCEMVTHPGVVGGWFRAIVWLNIRLAPSETVVAQLTCYHRYVTGSGKERSTHRDVQWQEDIVVDMSRVTVVQSGETAIPVMTYIPRACKQTTLEDKNDRIEWELTAKAEVSGIDLASSFIVPVFVTDESSDEAPSNEHGERVDEVIQPYTPTIAVRDEANGFSLYAAPRRNPGMMFGLTFFFVIWSAIVGFLFAADDVPFLFALVFGVFDFFIGWGTMWLWFGKCWMHVEKTKVTVTKEVFGFGTPKTVDAATILDVEPHINMRSGNTPYYAIRLKTGESSGKDTIGGLKSKDEAEDLCRRVRDVLGL